MTAPLHTEKRFQAELIESLLSQGWLLGTSSGYDQERALYPEDLLAFAREVNPKAWAKQEATYKDRAASALFDRAAEVVKKEGTLHLLREGISDRGASFTLCQFPPDHAMNPEAITHYAKVRLRVVPELVYSQSKADHLDLAFFVNGIAVATCELKPKFCNKLT